MFRHGLVLLLFAKKTFIHKITNIQCKPTNLGTMGAPNKAGIGITIRIYNKNICFIGCHLNALEKRNISLRNESF